MPLGRSVRAELIATCHDFVPARTGRRAGR
jgi:hypothetical protein